MYAFDFTLLNRYVFEIVEVRFSDCRPHCSSICFKFFNDRPLVNSKPD